jgi:hypothetical protein
MSETEKPTNIDQLEPRILDENDEHVDLTLGLIEQVRADGRMLVQKDYRVAGEVWRVHKNDPDPFPSRPHAHCIGGAARFIGLKLHLGTRQLFEPNNEPTERYLGQKQFSRLIEMIRPKFPALRLPLRND